MKKKKIKESKIIKILILIFLILNYIIIFMIGEIRNIGIRNYDTYLKNQIDDDVISNKIDDVVISNKINDVVISNKIDDDAINNQTNTTDKNNTNEENNNSGHITDSTYEKIISVKANGKELYEESELDIFKNSQFGNKNIIAPGSTGEYKFIIENLYDSSILCNTIFEEENEKNINLVYKIKLDGQYLNGEDQWKRIEDIKMENIRIDKNATCSLMWYWEDSENDTEIGLSSEEVKYKLKLKIIGMTDGE